MRVIIAATVMPVLNNAINLIDGVDASTEFAIIGMVILPGVILLLAYAAPPVSSLLGPRQKLSKADNLTRKFPDP